MKKSKQNTTKNKQHHQEQSTIEKKTLIRHKIKSENGGKVMNAVINESFENEPPLFFRKQTTIL